MAFDFKHIILFFSILYTGLTAGLCFTWTNAVTPGIGRLDDFTFLQSFQAMNRAIINPTFLMVFFGPAILLFLNAYLFRTGGQFIFWLFLGAGLLFFAGVVIITVTKNVPLNEMLDKTSLEQLSKAELKELRNTFEKPWNSWHFKRTLSSAIAFAMLIIGMMFNKL